MAKPVRRSDGDARGNYALAALSLGSGCADVLSFLKLGNIFTSAMTGNTALLALAVGRGDLVAAAAALAALLGFALGVALATATHRLPARRTRPLGGLRQLLILELVFLIACAALWDLSSDPLTGTGLYTVIVLSALSMGIQAVAASRIRPGIRTIVFTSVLIHIVVSATGALVHRRVRELAAGIKPHLQTFGAYIGGGLVAALCVSGYLVPVIWVPAAAVIAAFACSPATEAQAGET